MIRKINLLFCVAVVAFMINGLHNTALAQGSGDPVSPDDLRNIIDDVMNGPDFRRLRKGAGREQDASGRDSTSGSNARKQKDKGQKKESRSNSASSESFAAAAQGFAYGILYLALIGLAVAIGIAAILIIRSIDRKKAIPPLDPSGLSSEDALQPAAPPGEKAGSIYLQNARVLASKGDYRSALRELLIGSMSWIERAGNIRYRRGLTNRDYWRAVYRQPAKRDAFLRIASNFEQVFFGRRDASVTAYEHCLNSFLEEFNDEAIQGSA